MGPGKCTKMISLIPSGNKSCHRKKPTYIFAITQTKLQIHLYDNKRRIQEYKNRYLFQFL